MASSYTARNRVNKQGTGDNVNLWGDTLNSGVFDLFDTALDGWTTKALTANYSLTTANGSADEARARTLKFTGTGTYTVTIPSVEKWYLVWNALTSDLIITTGAGAAVTLGTGDKRIVFSDGAAVYEPGFGGSSIKTYVDNLAWTYNAGALPAQVGNADKYVSTDGTTAAWRTFSASVSDYRTGTSLIAAITPGGAYAGEAEVTLTSAAASIAADMATFKNAIHTMTENTTLANPTNTKVGQSGFLRFVQHASAAKTLAMGSNWKRVGGAIALPTTLSSTSVLEYQVITSTFILYDLLREPS